MPPKPNVNSTPNAFKLSSAFSPVPGKIVAKIRAGHYIDMRELLPDNISLRGNIESLASPLSLHRDSRPKLREIRSLLTWVTSFATYAAIAAEDNPQLIRPLMAYLCIIIREARKNGGDGWRSYDTIIISSECS